MYVHYSVYHYSLLFPFLLPLLIFCSHSSFLSPYPHTLNLQSISVSCTSWYYSVILLWTRVVLYCMCSHCEWPGTCLLDSTVRWVEITGCMWNMILTVSMFAGMSKLLLLCTYCQIPHLLNQTPWLHPLILCGFFLRVTTDYSWEWNSPNPT